MKNALLIIITIMMAVSCSQEPQTVEELEKAGKKAFVELDYFKARQYLSQAVAKKSSDRDLLHFLGLSYLRENMYDSAVVYLKRAELLYPGDRETNQNLLLAAMMSSEWRIARDAIAVMIKTGDSEQQHLEQLLEACVRMEDFMWGNYYARKLLDLYPDQPDRYLVASNTAVEMGSLMVAIEILDDAVEEFGPKPEFRTNKAMFLIAMKQYDKAEKIFRGLLAEDTTAITYKINLAHALTYQPARSKKEEGYRLYQEILPYYPDPQGLDSVLIHLRNELGLPKSDR